MILYLKKLSKSVHRFPSLNCLRKFWLQIYWTKILVPAGWSDHTFSPNSTTDGSRLILSYLLFTLLLFPFNILPYPVHLTVFSFCFFPGFLAIFILLSCNNNIFSFHLSPSPVHPTGFYFCFFPGFLVIFTLLSSNHNNNAKPSPKKIHECV